MGSFLTVLKNRDFRFLWLAQITSQIALNMLIFVLGIEVYRHTHSNTSVSLILLSFGLPSIFFGIPAGSIVDFYDKRTILIICNVSRALLLFLFFLFSRQILVLYLLSILMSIITQFFVPAEAPSIASLIKSKEELLPANSIFTISFYFSTIFGFIISGPAVRFLGPNFVYALMMLLMILASFFVAKLPVIKTPAKEKVKSLTVATIIDSMLEGLRFIRSHPRVGQSLMLLTFAQALISVLVVLAPGFADKIVHIPLEDASFLVMGPAAIGLVAVIHG
jgi:MFS family permease